MKNKNTELETLKKLFIETKEKNKITERFSYRFDSRSGRLILSYYVPTIVRDNGVVKTLNKKVEKYRKEIDKKNFRKYFKGRTSIVIDDSKFVYSGGMILNSIMKLRKHLKKIMLVMNMILGGG